MLNITKFNHTQERVFDVDLKEIKDWKKAKELLDKTIVIKAIGWHKSSNAKYGDSVFAIAVNNVGINLPSWMKDTVVEILKDEESVQEIKDGKVAINFTAYKTKSGDYTTNVNFVEAKQDITDSTLPY